MDECLVLEQVFIVKREKEKQEQESKGHSHSFSGAHLQQQDLAAPRHCQKTTLSGGLIPGVCLARNALTTAVNGKG